MVLYIHTTMGVSIYLFYHLPFSCIQYPSIHPSIIIIQLDPEIFFDHFLFPGFFFIHLFPDPIIANKQTNSNNKLVTNDDGNRWWTYQGSSYSFFSNIVLTNFFFEENKNLTNQTETGTMWILNVFTCKHTQREWDREG